MLLRQFKKKFIDLIRQIMSMAIKFERIKHIFSKISQNYLFTYLISF